MKLTDDMVIFGNRAICRSYAKINLTLDVLGKLENGYHELESVMQSVNLFDLVIVDKMPKGIQVSTNLKYLPNNEKNIAYQAAKLFFEVTGIRGGAKILIRKNIPVAAGLAGGSGNAAAVLAALNQLFCAPLSQRELFTVSKRLGADVPFCLMCGTQLTTGIGDVMKPIRPFPKKLILLVKPPVNIPTADIYRKLDSVLIPPHPKTADFISALECGNMEQVYASMFNVMEAVTEKEHPVISGIKEKLRRNGAKAAMMSGSGSTVFGLFDDYKKAFRSQESFSRMYQEVYLTHTN